MKRLAQIFSTALFLTAAAAAEPHRLAVDFSATNGQLRALHGINNGPLAANGLVVVTEAQKRLHLPFTRLHDCHFPNPDVVDIHTIFPNPDADPAKPSNYDFRTTDEYLAAVRATGAEIVFRLGESIEHGAVKRHVNPPRDLQRWAAVCAGIVRHYNEGWAGGYRYGIRYWEIWNEPENRPVMWTGTDAQFLELYAVTARTLRAEFPEIKIGGAAFGYYGKFDGKTLVPSEFVAAFLHLCRRESLPLDFFSWHCYTADPAELSARARAVRRLLDEGGFLKTESHLNEWNYLPGGSWDIVSRTVTPEARQRAYEQMMGAKGGAFLAVSLIELQDAPVEVCNFFHGETGLFGLFTEVGAPTRNFYAMLAFAQLLETPLRLRVEGGIPGSLAIAAGTNPDQTKAAMLIANLSGPDEVRLVLGKPPWPGGSEIEVFVVDEVRALEPSAVPPGSEITLHLPPPSVAIVTLRPLKK